MYLEPGYTGPKRVRPSELKYCHGTISNTFGDGTPLEKTFEDLVFGRMRPQDLPPVETMYYPFGGILCVTNGNRRLFILQKLEACGVISEITVMVREFDAELFKSKNLSLCNGSYVKVRDGNDLEEKLKNIWKTRSGLFGKICFWRNFQLITVPVGGGGGGNKQK